MKMSRRRGRSSGWAAYDLKQQQKELEFESDPYPPISSNIAPSRPYQNSLKDDDLSLKSFSSVLQPSVNFPILMANKDTRDTLQIGNSSTNHSQIDTSKKNDFLESYKKLKELHSWADKNLIDDIMEAVNNDIDKASTILKGMVAPNILEEKKVVGYEDMDYNFEDVHLDKNALLENIDPCLRKTTDPAELADKKQSETHVSCGKLIPETNDNMKLILDNLRFIPVEPEWEEDDIYQIHRKDAIRMMRSAARHSKAANDAYLRGDHLSAQEFSVKAREEWYTAEKLNAKAAKDILNIRNFSNDDWKLDLHGLHSAEAVQALQEHLHKIECQGLLNRSTHPNRDMSKIGIRHAASLESLTRMEIDQSEKQQKLPRQRATLLEVITGRGNHGRGQAALPAAIRSFLSEKGYHFDEARPGMITVRPKFRPL